MVIIDFEIIDIEYSRTLNNPSELFVKHMDGTQIGRFLFESQ